MSNSTPDITIQYVDEIRCKIVARREIMIALKGEFSFFAEGYKFHPLYKQGRWDGRISMIDGKGLFYNGLLKSLLKYCKSKTLSINVEDIARYKADIISDETINKLASYIKFTPYDYQLASIKEGLSKRKMLCISPTGSGKSIIAHLFYRYCMDNNIPLLITVPSVGLVSQLYSDFQEYIADDHSVEDNVHCIFAGQEKNTNKNCVISTWQSLATIEDPTWFKRFGFYICDEAHLAKGAEISKIIDNLNTCRYRVGMTGTLSGAAMHEIEMQARFGDIFKMVTTRELIDRGILTDLDINCMRLVYPKAEVDRFHGFCKNDYQREIDYLINSVERNNYIVNLGLTLPGTNLMLFNRVEGHGMLLMEMLEEKCIEHKKKVFYISGKVKAKERERIRKLLDGEMPLFNTVTFTNGSTKVFDDEVHLYRDIKSMVGSCLPDTYYAEDDDTSRIVASVDQSEGAYILLASYGTMSTGISIKKLDNLVFCHPYKGRILNLQSIGRILRKSVTKDMVQLYDLIDDFRKGKKENHTYKHGTIRMEIYESEEFNYELHEVKLGS